MTNTTITIINSSTLGRTVTRSLAVFNGVIAPIGVGVLVDSAAMQWAGFVMGSFIALAFAKMSLDPYRYKTADEAKAALDAMKARGEVP